MQLVGIGTDIERVSRFKQIEFHSNERFFQRIFSDREIRYCLSKAQPHIHFTGRFCAKEAVVKALGSSRVTLRDVEIINDRRGVPHAIAKNAGKATIHVSISHTPTLAVACAVAVLE